MEIDVPPPAPFPLPAKRRRRVPKLAEDMIPSYNIGVSQFRDAGFARLQHNASKKKKNSMSVREPTPEASPESSRPPTPRPFRTEPDEFGLFREYRVLPQREPSEELDVFSVADAPTFIRNEEAAPDPTAGFGRSKTDASSVSWFAPFLNASVFLLMQWFYKSMAKSLNDLNDLVYEVILHPEFKKEDLEGFNANREVQRLDDNAKEAKLPPTYEFSDRWTETPLSVPLPHYKASWESEQRAPHLEVPTAHRKLTEIIRSACEDPINAAKFDWKGFIQWWKPSPDEKAQRVYGEAYTSDVFTKWKPILFLHRGVHSKLL